jgi:hypothetical protein
MRDLMTNLGVFSRALIKLPYLGNQIGKGVEEAWKEHIHTMI